MTSAIHIARAPRRTLAGVLLAAVGSLLLAFPASAPAFPFSGSTLRSTSVLTDYAAQHILVRIVCPGLTRSTPRSGDFSFCTGTIVMTYRGSQVASGPFSVRTYDSHIEAIRVNRGARWLFRPRRPVRVDFRMTSRDGAGNTASRSGTLTVLNLYKR